MIVIIILIIMMVVVIMVSDLMILLPMQNWLMYVSDNMKYDFYVDHGPDDPIAYYYDYYVYHNNTIADATDGGVNYPSQTPSPATKIK